MYRGERPKGAKDEVKTIADYSRPSPRQTYRPERLKGAKDEVKRPEGPSARSRGPEGPLTSSIMIYMIDVAL